jgi:hypothetical protein
MNSILNLVFRAMGMCLLHSASHHRPIYCIMTFN